MLNPTVISVQTTAAMTAAKWVRGEMVISKFLYLFMFPVNSGMPSTLHDVCQLTYLIVYVALSQFSLPQMQFYNPEHW
jgi:hypothetical protein